MKKTPMLNVLYIPPCHRERKREWNADTFNYKSLKRNERKHLFKIAIHGEGERVFCLQTTVKRIFRYTSALQYFP